MMTLSYNSFSLHRLLESKIMFHVFQKYSFALILMILIILFGIAGCEKDFFSSDNGHDQPGENPVDEGEGVDVPWSQDNLYPLIKIKNPKAGEFVTEYKVLVSGNVEGPTPEDFSINDKSISLTAGGNFTAIVSCDPIGPLLPITALATTDEVVQKERVLVIHGEGQNENEPIAQAFAFNITETFLDVLADIMVEMVMGFPFDQVLELINPIIDFAGVIFEIPDVTFGDINMVLEPVDEGLSIHTIITDLTVELYGEVDLLGIPIILEGDATAGTIEFTALATAQSDGQGGATVVMENVNTQLMDFALHVENIPDWLFTIVNVVTREVMEFIVDFVFKNVIPGAINALLEAIHIDGQLGDLKISIGYESFNIDASGISGVFEGNVLPLTASPNAPVASESLVTPGSLSPFPKTTPTLDQPYDLALTIGDDLVNRAFFAITKTGLLQIDIPSPMEVGNLEIELTTGSLAGIFPSLENVDPQLPVRIILNPGAPPVISPYTVGGKQAMFALAGYNLQIFIDTGDPVIGQWEAFSIAFDIAAQAGLNLDNQGGISLDLEVPLIEAQVVRNQIGEENARLISFVLDILQTQLDPILEQLSGIRIQIPEILGTQIVPVEIDNGGGEKDYFTIYLRFER